MPQIRNAIPRRPGTIERIRNMFESPELDARTSTDDLLPGYSPGGLIEDNTVLHMSEPESYIDGVPVDLDNTDNTLDVLKRRRLLDHSDETTDAVNPDHYQYSNGAQLIDITENLSFNGGNAVKYIARSTRLDGRNKGEVLQDLEKALWYVNKAIEQEKKNVDN